MPSGDDVRGRNQAAVQFQAVVGFSVVLNASVLSEAYLVVVTECPDLAACKQSSTCVILVGPRDIVTGFCQRFPVHIGNTPGGSRQPRQQAHLGGNKVSSRPG